MNNNISPDLESSVNIDDLKKLFSEYFLNLEEQKKQEQLQQEQLQQEQLQQEQLQQEQLQQEQLQLLQDVPLNDREFSNDGILIAAVIIGCFFVYLLYDFFRGFIYAR